MKLFDFSLDVEQMPWTVWAALGAPHSPYSGPEDSLFLCRGDGVVRVGEGEAGPGESGPPSEVLGEDAR